MSTDDPAKQPTVASNTDTAIVRTAAEQIHYDALQQWIRSTIADKADCLFDVVAFENASRYWWETYGVPVEALDSFLFNEHVKHIKKNTGRIRAMAPQLFHEYHRKLQLEQQHRTRALDTSPSSSSNQQGVLHEPKNPILRMARRVHFPPFLLGRHLLEQALKQGVVLVPALSTSHNNNNHNKVSNQTLTKMMRDPVNMLLGGGDNALTSSLQERSSPVQMDPFGSIQRQIAYHLQSVRDIDPMHGPRHDRKRHMIGLEYEVLLQHKLRLLGIAFETEDDLRKRGTARTPDILLQVPVAVPVPCHGNNSNQTSNVEWKIICWIDSKAMFGDVNTHRTDVLPQAESYLNRFGPGMVLYWFGHAPADRLAEATTIHLRRGGGKNNHHHPPDLSWHDATRNQQLHISHSELVIWDWDLPDRMMLPSGQIREAEDGLHR